MSELLTAVDVGVERGEQVLFRQVNLTLVAGELVQLTGSNGCGKTTLLRILAGLGTADAGELFWCGVPLARQRQLLREQSLYIGHKPGISAELTPVENLCFLAGLQQPVSRQRALQALTDIGLEARVDVPCRVLSAGQKRRVALARLGFSKARLWILDEPLTALDLQARSWLELQLQQHIEQGNAALVSTHTLLDIELGGQRCLRLQADGLSDCKSALATADCAGRKSL